MVIRNTIFHDESRIPKTMIIRSNYLLIKTPDNKIEQWRRETWQVGETNGNIMKWCINSWIIANIGVADESFQNRVFRV